MAGEITEVDYKYGKKLPFEHNLQAPLWRKRSCTDVPCLLLFLVFLGAWVFIATYAWRNGDLNKFVLPTDSLNKTCGIDSGVLNKNYLFFFNLYKCIDPLIPITDCPTPQICVEQCPTETFIWDTMRDQLSFEDWKAKLICLTDADKEKLKTKEHIEKAINDERCAGFYIKSAPLLNRCIWEFSPQVCEDTQTNLTNITNSNTDIQSEAHAPMSNLSQTVDPKLPQVEEPIGQCRRRQQLGETVKEKIMQTDTKFDKFSHMAQQVAENVVEDILNSYIVILTALLYTLVASLIFIALMRWLALPILWTSIFGVLTGLVVAIYFSIKQYMFYHHEAIVPQYDFNFDAADVLQDERFWFYLSIFLCIFLIILLIILIVLRNRISIAVALIKEGSRAVSSVKSTVFVPIFSWILFIIVIAYTVGVDLYLETIGENSFRIRQLDPKSLTGVTQESCKCEGPAANYKIGANCDPPTFEKHCYNAISLGKCSETTCSFLEIQPDILTDLFIVYNAFGYLWLTFFISAFSDMALACTFATWYWTFKKENLRFFTLTKAIFQTSFYHLGTLAFGSWGTVGFGSIILYICRIIRFILKYVDKKVKKYDNAVTNAILRCMRRFLWLSGKSLCFLSRNTYIMCAIHGNNFCSSAEDAYNLTKRNLLRVVNSNPVIDFVFFMSKLLISGGAGVATYFFLLNNPSIIQLHYRETPTVVVALCAYLATSVFFSVYSMAVDTLFLCFLEDIERNDGSPEKPYYMSKQLMKLLSKCNLIPKGTPLLEMEHETEV